MNTSSLHILEKGIHCSPFLISQEYDDNFLTENHSAKDIAGLPCPHVFLTLVNYCKHFCVKMKGQENMSLAYFTKTLYFIPGKSSNSNLSSFPSASIQLTSPFSFSWITLNTSVGLSNSNFVYVFTNSLKITSHFQNPVFC